MSRRKRSFTPGLREFISKVITPVVLVTGVLFLVYFNFSSILKAQQAAGNQFTGLVAFNQGNFAYHFQETSGIDRPVLRYNGVNLLTYADWSSTVSIDGNVQELYNSNEGYDIDQNKMQIYNTASGDGWQLIKTVTLVNDHTVTVTFQFVARPVSLPGPTSYQFTIAHVITVPNEWYNIQTTNSTLSASVLQANGIPAPTSSTPVGYGTLSFSVEGSAFSTPVITLHNEKAYVRGASTITLAQRFSTEYTVIKPPPLEMITLGTETLTFEPTLGPAGAPPQGVVPLPEQ